MDIAQLIQQGSTSLILLLPIALAIGALHGLEPGHSKTMMAAFIIAVKGTPAQAALLGLSAAISHSLVVWGIALIGLYLGETYVEGGAFEAGLKLISAAIMIGIGLWMLWQINAARRAKAKTHNHHHHGHDHDHHHDHHHDAHAAQDAHALKHAREIETTFASGKATTGQIIAFGLTGGLLPCPASITVLLLCLQLKKVALGMWLVLGFSVGLALTLVLVGVGASLAFKGVSGRFSKLEGLMKNAPYISALIILALGVIMALSAITTPFDPPLSFEARLPKV